MKNEYDFKIGSNINDVHILPAFNHPLKARFIISVIDNSTELSKKWLSIDQSSESIVISTNKLKSVGEYIIHFNARLVTFDINYSNTLSYTTLNYKVEFNFLNSNWAFITTNSSYYTIINQLSILMLEFYDLENDNIILALIHNDEISLYSQQDSTSKQRMKLFMQANTNSEDSIKIMIFYTDFYHQDPSFYQNFTISVYPFLVDPPSFDNNLETFNANR